MQTSAAPRIYLGFAAAAYIALWAIVLTQSGPPIFDEGYHATFAQRLVDAQTFRSWLLDNDRTATGPVHALMHYALSGGKGVLPNPWMRVPNLILLAGMIALTAATLRRTGQDFSLARAASVMTVPMTYVLSGLALTEIPAAAALALAIYAIVRLADEPEKSMREKLSGIALVALGFGLSVCGRQTYLVTLPALLALGVRGRRIDGAVVTGIAIGALPTLWLFATWGGVLPPKLAFAGEGPPNPLHAVYALSYAGVVSLLVAPRFFLEQWRWAVGAAALAMIGNMATGITAMTTLTSAQKLWLPPAAARGLAYAGSQLFVAAGAAFVVVLVLQLWRRRDLRLVAHGAGVLLLCLACARVTHLFSSRYIGMALPFWIPLLAPWIDVGLGGAFRLAIGAGLGSAVLISYFAIN